jgi:ferritin-like protein
MSPIVMDAIKKALEQEREHADELASRILELEGLPIRNPKEWDNLAHCKYIEPPEDPTHILHIGYDIHNLFSQTLETIPTGCTGR